MKSNTAKFPYKLQGKDTRWQWKFEMKCASLDADSNGESKNLFNVCNGNRGTGFGLPSLCFDCTILKQTETANTADRGALVRQWKGKRRGATQRFVVRLRWRVSFAFHRNQKWRVEAFMLNRSEERRPDWNKVTTIICTFTIQMSVKWIMKNESASENLKRIQIVYEPLLRWIR